MNDKVTEVELLKEIVNNPYPLIWWGVAHQIVIDILTKNKEGKNMPIINKEIVTKEFIITEAEMRKKLGITGKIENIELFKGLSMNEEKEGKDTNEVEWLFTTIEIKNQLVR